MSKIKSLSPKHQQLARLLVGGNSQAEIARILSLHKATVSRLAHDPLVASEVERLQTLADVNSTSCVPGIPEKISEGAYKGIEVLEAILNDERNDADILKLKANVALEMLARAGYGPIKQLNVQQSSINACLSKDDIELIKSRAIKLTTNKQI